MKLVGSLLLAGLVLVPSLSLGGEEVGRLFFTPDQRARLDEVRQQQRTAVVPQQEDAEPVTGSITLNGVVTRGDGQAVIWINNRPQSAQAAGVGIEKAGTGRAGSQVRVTVPDGRRSVPLKVGQSLDLGSGKVMEPYQPRPAPPLPVQDKDKSSSPGAAVREAGTPTSGERDVEEPENGGERR